MKLRLVPKIDRPLAKLSHAEKLANAKAYLQRKGKYILDRGTPKPGWGLANEQPKEINAELARKIMDSDRRRSK
jgi:hypothetical protein